MLNVMSSCDGHYKQKGLENSSTNCKETQAIEPVFNIHLLKISWCWIFPIFVIQQLIAMVIFRLQTVLHIQTAHFLMKCDFKNKHLSYPIST